MIDWNNPEDARKAWMKEQLDHIHTLDQVEQFCKDTMEWIGEIVDSLDYQARLLRRKIDELDKNEGGGAA